MSMQLIRTFVARARVITGADVTSLYLEARYARGGKAMLLHHGRHEAVPELRDHVSALEFVSAESGAAEICSEKPLRLLRSEHGQGRIIRVAAVLTGAGGSGEATPDERRSNLLRDQDEADVACLWLGLAYPKSEVPALVDELENYCRGASQQMPRTQLDWLATSILGAANLVGQVYDLIRLIQDPTTGLPGRSQFQADLKSAFLAARSTNQPLGLLLVNPDGFEVVNRRYDRERGDEVLRLLAEKLQGCLRSSDVVFRFGGAVFAVLLPATKAAAVTEVAAKVRQELTRSQLDDTLRLTFSVGAAQYEPEQAEGSPQDEIDMLRRADQALNAAKNSGGGRMVAWEPGESADAGVSLDRLSGIFTADTEKDYRNMLLLWDTIAVISSSTDMDDIASEFVDRIQSTLKPTRVALYVRGEEDAPRMVASDAAPGAANSGTAAVSRAQDSLLERVAESRRTDRMRFSLRGSDASQEVSFMAYAVPMLARGEYLGCLYIDGPEHVMVMDSSDLMFLNALTTQVALALDRAQLASSWKELKERESQELRKEVHDLRQVLHSAKLVYRSVEMETVLDTLRSVAPTDVTILITGESGTGKEMLARSIHEQSARAKQALVTVDCGAIAHSLMEAELFGYVKGAYTGAVASSEGRIVQADGGTLFLDEIGEIPLDVQAKLLRFVQEKELSAVGSTSYRRVDVRIVAATNRDLSEEVKAGRFREDLYYRLKVVTVTAPPLRERPADILPLAQHFLDKFALQYEKGLRRFSPELEQMLLVYRWPGNVRELQNTMLRAVVLSSGELMGPGDVTLGSEASDRIEGSVVRTAESAPTPGGADIRALEESPASSEAEMPSLQQALREQVDTALQNREAPVPLGRWLTEDLVLAADSAAATVARRAAAMLGMAESTYRRHLEKVQRAQQNGLLARSPAWSAMAPVLKQLVDSCADNPGAELVDSTRSILLEEVAARIDGNASLGAALMGVTQPTYRRWSATAAA